MGLVMLGELTKLFEGGELIRSGEKRPPKSSSNAGVSL